MKKRIVRNVLFSISIVLFGVCLGTYGRIYAAQKLPAPKIIPGDSIFISSRLYYKFDVADSHYVFYTTDGSDPTEHDSKARPDVLYITKESCTVKAINLPHPRDTQWLASDISTVHYQQKASKPYIWAEWSFPDTAVIILPGSSEITVYYTLDGSTPDTTCAIYDGVIRNVGVTIIKAFTTAPGYLPSDIACDTLIPPGSDLRIYSPEDGKKVVNVCQQTKKIKRYNLLGREIIVPYRVLVPGVMVCVSIKDGLRNIILLEADERR